MGKMYYNRLMSSEIEELLSGKYHWLINFVKQHDELDFQTGANAQQSWFSIYRGTARLFGIKINYKGASEGIEQLYAHPKYMNLEPELYKNPTKELFESLIVKIKEYKCPDGENIGKNTLERYFDNRREGFHQNNISRRYGICGKADDEIIIVDKESVIGFKSDTLRKSILNELSLPYQEIKNAIVAAKESRFPSKLGETKCGNECDFIVLTRSGELILMELKDYKDTQKIYLSPFQISMYCDIFNRFDKESKGQFRETILAMVKQKQELGLLNPSWPIPGKITKISAALVVGFASPNKLSDTAVKNYNIVRKHVKEHAIAVYSTVGDSGELNEMIL